MPCRFGISLASWSPEGVLPPEPFQWSRPRDGRVGRIWMLDGKAWVFGWFWVCLGWFLMSGLR